ncbi:uncharacterized protein moto [Odontesthes bonariensis]|uniref:uncharacterized protein moto n=1 Tax=Odontesthes bonariensis TaxID=219752 RepID=UPI003F586450
MAFDGHQSTFANSLFQTYQRQTGINVGGINGGGVPVPFVSVPGASHQEQDNASCIPWSHITQDDPYELIRCTQTTNKSSKPTDNVDCEGEADLQGLVSNILDEAETQDSYHSESLPTCNPIWSPKTLREELLQYFHSEAKTLHNPSFPSNHLSHETFSKAQQQSVDKEVEELSHQSGGLATKQWLFNLPDGDSHSFRPQKLPPGLSVPNTVKTNPYQMQQSKYVSMLAYNDRGNDQPMNNFPELIDIFRPQNETQKCLDALYEDHYIQSNVNSVCNEQYFPEDMNQLIKSSQSFMAYEHDKICNGEFPNIYKQTAGIHKEDCVNEQWKSPAMSTQSALAMQVPKQLLGDLGAVQRGRNGGVKKQTFKLDAFQGLPDFNPHHTEIFQQPKAFSAPVNLPNHHLNRMTMNRENINLSMNQYSKLCMQQSQMNKKLKPQLQKEKKRMHVSGFLEGISRRQRPNTHMTEAEKQPFSQNPYFNFQGNVQSQFRDRESCMVTAGNIQQFTPFMYPVNDLKRHSGMPINSNFSSRSTLSHGNGVPGMDMNGRVSANEAAALSSYVSDMRAHRGETMFHGMVPALTPPLMMTQGGPVIQLYYLDECYEERRCLEKERKKAEIVLRKTFSGRRTTAVTSTNLPKTPPNPTRIDLLVVNHMREQAKVSSLLVRMKCLCGSPLHINIQTALKSHHMAVCITQARCKDGANTTKHQQQGLHFTEDRDTLLMTMALKDLAAATRRLCSALWCALQMTLPKPPKMEDHHDYEEATCTERCSSSFQGYSVRS